MAAIAHVPVRSARQLEKKIVIGYLGHMVANGSDPAMDHSYSTRPEMIWAGSWKYSPAELSTVSTAEA